MCDKMRDDKQRQKFIETARSLGCDDDEATFKAKLAVIARQKPKDRQPPPEEPKKGRRRA